jgi:glyoxylase-like metal-dependent hydrolase (beta-lactamase superfamily II)
VDNLRMRRLLLFGVLGLLFFVAYARTADMQAGTVQQLAPGVWTKIGDQPPTRLPANTSWIEFKDFVVVIEANTPSGINPALAEIKKTTSKPIRYVFDTHYHWDHTQGNSILADQNVTIVCSQECANELAGPKGTGEWASMSRNTTHSLAPYRLQQPNVTFGDFMAIDDGTRRLELKRVGPGHTIGDSVAYLPKEGILFTGDLVVNWKFGNNVGDRDADIPNWSKVLLELAKPEVKAVVPGHGSVGTIETLKGQSAFLADLWKQVSDGKKAGKTLEQLTAEIDLSKNGDWAADQNQNRSAIRAAFRKAP